MRTSLRYQAGLSLVELMVALLIGVILTSGVISVYITSKSSYSMNSGLGQVQEEGRFALQTLQPILVQAGSTGCAHNLVTSVLSSTDEVYTFGDAVYGFEFKNTGIGDSYDDNAANGAATNQPTVDNTASDWSPALSNSPLAQAALNGIAVQYSDVLMVHEMLGNAAPIVAGTTPATIKYDGTYLSSGLTAGEVLMASNCVKSANLFQAGTVSSSDVATNGSGTAIATDFNSYVGGAWVGPAQTYIFFVGKGLDKSTSLFEVKLETDNSNGKVGQFGTPVEIVPGVENMQVLYGLDSDGDKVPNQYVTADNVTSWGSVVSVRVALLVHSDDNSVDKAPAATTNIHLLGVTSTDSFTYKPYLDRRMRRYFAETFFIRNTLQ